MMILKKRLLFDTHAFLAFFNKEEGSEVIKKLMDEIQKESVEGYVTTVTLTELAYIYVRRVDEILAKTRIMQIQNSKLTVVPLSAEIAIDAGISKGKGISVDDAIIAATARSIGASVVTNDAHFLELHVPVIGYP